MRRAELNRTPRQNGAGSDDLFEGFPERIKAASNKQVESIIETGRVLIEAKEQLGHGRFGDMFKQKPKVVPFGWSTADKLMKIAEHPILSNSENFPKLPPSWGMLFQLTTLPDDVLLAMLADGTIHPELECKEVDEIIKNVREHDDLYSWPKLIRALDVLVAFKQIFPETAPLAEAVFDTDKHVDLSDREPGLIWLKELFDDLDRKEQEHFDRLRNSEPIEVRTVRDVRRPRPLARAANE